MGILGTLQIQTVALPCEQCRVASARCLHRNTTLLTTQPKMATAIFGFGLTRAPNRTWGLDRKNTIVGKSRWKEATAHNERFCEMAAVTPQKRQCEFGSYYPAGSLVKPPPRKAAGALAASGGQCSGIDRKIGKF
jgi:hypothetical protein